MKRHPALRLVSTRGHRARLSPTLKQAATLPQWTGAARFLWNLALEQHTLCPHRGINKVGQCRDLTELRAEVDWIRDLPAQVAQQTLADLDLAYQRSHVGLARRPQRKRRFRNEASLRFPQQVEVRRLNRRWGAVRLQKLGWVKFRWTRELVGTVKNATVSRDASGSTGAWRSRS